MDLSALQKYTADLPMWGKLTLTFVGYGCTGLGSSLPSPWGVIVSSFGGSLLLVLGAKGKSDGPAPAPTGK
jgi:hypothetical protein